MSLSHLVTCSVCKTMQPRSAFPDLPADAPEGADPPAVCSGCQNTATRRQEEANAVLPLFTTNAIVLATLIGSFLGGFALVTLNYVRLRDTRSAWIWGLMTPVIAVGYITATIFIPQAPILGTFQWLGPCIVMHLLGKHLFEEELIAQVANKTSPASYGLAALIGLGGMLLSVGLFVVIIAVLIALGIIQAA